jgi:hypothetical protein
MEKMKQWTKEWYEDCTTEELSRTLNTARQSFGYVSKTEQDAATLMWRFRILKLQEALAHRISPK